jgi:DNA-binding response OmpR family regulator
MAVRVLLIDDDARLAELLGGYFAQHDVTMVYARDGHAGLRALGTGAFDAVLLDVMMPGVDGLEVLRKIRAGADRRVPVLMLTARGDEADRVVGLELGADDYIAKPFSSRELLARLRAVMRRAQPGVAGERLTAAGIVVDVAAREVTVDGESVELTGLELDLLTALVRRAGRVVPRSALLAEAGRDDVTVSERAVDVHVSKLRKKLGERRIRTVRGLGYVVPKELKE